MIEKILRCLEERLSKERLLHSLGVAKVAKRLGMIYDIDIQRLEIAALLHDIGKEMEIGRQPEFLKKNGVLLTEEEMKCQGIIHAYVSSIVARNEFKIEDDDIINAIRYHPTGHPDYKIFEKVIFASDYLDPSRRLRRQKEILRITLENIDSGIIEIIKEKINYIISNREFLHPLTIDFYNKLLEKSPISHT